MSLLPISIFRNRPTTTPPIITPGDEFTVYQYIGNNSHILASGSYITYVIIAGGGGGGGGDPYSTGGGGGAGGVIVKILQYFSPGTYPIIVGSKGTGSSNGVTGGNGGNSVFNSLTAIGGGGGCGSLSASAGNGGSGGGAAPYGVAGTGTTGQGNSGGNASISYSAGGGGGFGGAGTSGALTSPVGGAGGAGSDGFAEGGGGGGESLGGNDPGNPYTVTTNAGVGGYGVAPFGPYAATSATGYGCGGGGGPPDASYSGGNGSPGTVILYVYAGLAPTSVTITSLSKTLVSVTWSRATSAGISILIYQSASTPVTTGNTLIATGYSSPVTISGTANYYYAAVVIARYTSEISNSEYIATIYGPAFDPSNVISNMFTSYYFTAAGNTPSATVYIQGSYLDIVEHATYVFQVGLVRGLAGIDVEFNFSYDASTSGSGEIGTINFITYPAYTNYPFQNQQNLTTFHTSSSENITQLIIQVNSVYGTVLSNVYINFSIVGQGY